MIQSYLYIIVDGHTNMKFLVAIKTTLDLPMAVKDEYSHLRVSALAFSDMVYTYDQYVKRHINSVYELYKNLNTIRSESHIRHTIANIECFADDEFVDELELFEDAEIRFEGIYTTVSAKVSFKIMKV